MHQLMLPIILSILVKRGLKTMTTVWVILIMQVPSTEVQRDNCDSDNVSCSDNGTLEVWIKKLFNTKSQSGQSVYCMNLHTIHAPFCCS